MVAILRLLDETTAGVRTEACSLRVEADTLTVRELITRRVADEVARYNASEAPRWLIAPTPEERARNGARAATRRPLDPAAQAAIALRAFERNGFFVLFDGRQVHSLDEPLALKAEAEVIFLALVPLAGG